MLELGRMKESDAILRPKEHKDQHHHHQPIEVCLIGDGMVGKTKLAQAFTGQEIVDETKKLINTYTGRVRPLLPWLTNALCSFIYYLKMPRVVL